MDCSTLIQFTLDIGVWIKELLNSNFITALAGAAAGAYGAQAIATKLKNKEILLNEIRDTNVAISLALQISNIFFTLKKQHLNEMIDNFNSEKERALEFLNAQDRELIQYNIDIELTFQKNFQLLNPVATPVESLKKVLFDNVSIGTRSIMAMCELEQCVTRFNSTLEMRNKFIDAERQKGTQDKNGLEEMICYFGLDIGNENINTFYSDIMNNLDIDCNGSLFYSIFLIAELVNHGKSLVEKSGDKGIKINDPNFSKAVREGLMPLESDYDNWKSMFK